MVSSAIATPAAAAADAAVALAAGDGCTDDADDGTVDELAVLPAATVLPPMPLSASATIVAAAVAVAAASVVDPGRPPSPVDEMSCVRWARLFSMVFSSDRASSLVCREQET